MANKIRLQRSATTGVIPTPGDATTYGAAAVNVTDRKLFVNDSTGNPVAVADKILPFSAARAYAVDDIIVRSGALYMATAAVSPGAFNPAQWDAIGGGDAASILKAPTGTDSNKITTSAARKGLVIQGASTQTANLFEAPGTLAGDGRSAFIDPLGFPSDRFAPNIFRVSQVSHPFLYRGQPVAFTSGQWVPADASDPDRGAVAVVEQRLDDNQFVLRTGGRIENLQAASFTGGSITPGATYYVSDTEPGKLTTTASPTRPDPVLVALSGSTGIVVAGTGVGATEYLAVAGGTMAGPLTMSDANELRFSDAATAVYKQAASPSILMKVAGAVAGRVDEAGNAAGYTTTVMTREKGDARYLRLSGDAALGGFLRLQTGTEAAPALQFDNANNGIYWQPGTGARFTASGATIAQLDGSSTASNANDIITRTKGDNRYVALAGSTMTGRLTLSANPTASLHAATKDYVDNAVSGLLSASAANSTYALRSTTVTGNVGINGGGSLAANRQLSLDLTYTDGRYPRRNGGTGSYVDMDGRFDVKSTHGSGIVTRFHDGNSGVATIYRSGDASFSGVVTAGGNLELGHGGSNAFLNNSGSGDLQVRFGGSSSFYFDRNGGLSSNLSVVRRSTGDDRYVQQSDFTSLNNVISVAMLRAKGPNVALSPGTVVNGSDMWYSSAGGRVDHPGNFGASSPTGRWKVMGVMSSYSNNSDDETTICVKVSN